MNQNESVMTYESLTSLKEQLDLIFTKSIVFSKSIPNAWEQNSIFLNDSRFKSSDRFCYMVFPEKDSRLEYMNNDVYPNNITEDGILNFTCESQPTTELAITILRMEVQ